MNHNAIRALYPQVVTISDIEGAFDNDGNKVEIDEVAVNAKDLELQAAEIAAQQAAVAAKASAQVKLAALGLTANEVKALLGIK
jgi:hypothetical protein